MERPKELAIGLLAAMFIVGGALGYAGGRWAAAREGMPGERGTMRRYIAEQLDLNATQVAQMDSILDQRRDLMQRIIAPVQPQLDSARTAARARIMAILSPAQQKKFQELLAAHDRAEGAPRR